MKDESGHTFSSTGELYPVDERLVKRLRQWSQVFACILVAIGILVLVGWFLQINALTRPIPGSVAMHPLTAISFILFGSAFLFLSSQKNIQQKKRIGIILLCLLITFSLIRLIGDSFHWRSHIDTIIFREWLKFDGSNPARMALITAVCFFFSGISLLLLSGRSARYKTIAQYTALIVFFIALFAVLGYIYRIPEFTGMFPFLSMAVHTAVGLLITSLTILFAYPEDGFMRQMAGAYGGSVTAQKLIPFALIIPIALGFVRLLAHWKGLISTELGVSLLVISIIIVYLLTIWSNILLLNKRDHDKKNTDKKFEMLLETAPDAMVITNSKAEILLVNKQSEIVFGYSRNELIGQAVEILIPDSLEKIHRIHRNEYFSDPKTRSMGAGLELFAKRKDGSQFPVEISLSPLWTSEGLLVSASVRDITDRKKAEEKFRSLLDAAPDATVIVDEKGVIQMINDQTENLFGYERYEMIGKPVEMLMPAELRSRHVQHRANFARFPKVRTMGVGIELNAVKKDGTTFPVEISLSPIDTDEGMLVSASVRDISIRKELENELKKSNAELEAFTYSVSHDLRAPLRGIIGFTSILEEDYALKLDDEARRITDIIKKNTLKMGHLIDDLLTFSRMGKREIIKTKVNSDQMVDDVINEINKDGIRWNVLPLPSVNADISTLRQVWVNLISNAIKYSGKKETPRIEVGSYNEDRFTVFYVRDNGVGFDKQYSHKLFKVFQRLHSDDQFEGTGIGLALVEKIVSKHGGRVWADGDMNEGACFYFSLPS